MVGLKGGLGRLSGIHKLAGAIAWRGFWTMDDRFRGALWGSRLGFDPRDRALGGVALVEPRISSVSETSLRRPKSDAVGVISSAGDAGTRPLLGEVARFYGLAVHETADAGGPALFERATRERWPLVGTPMDALDHSGAWRTAASVYVEGGGTLLIGGVRPGRGGLEMLSAELGVRLPEARRLDSRPREAVFSSREPALTREFAGVGVQTSEDVHAISREEGHRVIASVWSSGGLEPAVAEVPVGHGRVVVSVGASEVASLASVVRPLLPLAALPPMMLVRQLYGEAAWAAPWSFANFIIDDPALRNGRLGLDYDHVLAQARAHGFHLTIATVPRELELAQPGVVEMLRANGRWLSACYHGSDHSGYEFFLPQGRRFRYRARSLAVQERALDRAVARGEAFARRTGLGLDRVMVFPHGIGSPGVLAKLQRLGFISACNFDDRYPLASALPDDFDLGLRPADLAWAGFPLMWRRGLDDRMFILDLFLGRPAITFGHEKALGRDMTAFAERADELNSIGGIRWASLEDISRHCYLQRHDPRYGWQVAMMSNEICLHNPDAAPRTYSIERRHLPDGFAIGDGAGALRGTRGRVSVVVPAGDSLTIRLHADGDAYLSPGSRCSIGGAAQRSTA